MAGYKSVLITQMVLCYVTLAQCSMQHVYCYNNSNKYVPQSPLLLYCNHSSVQTDSVKHNLYQQFTLCVALFSGCEGSTAPMLSTDRRPMTGCVHRRRAEKSRVVTSKSRTVIYDCVGSVAQPNTGLISARNITRFNKIITVTNSVRYKQTQIKRIEVLKFRHFLKFAPPGRIRNI